MEQSRRRTEAFYLPADMRDEEIAPEQVTPSPRPGHGTVYLHKGRSLERRIVWAAKWVDPLPGGHTAGIEEIEGTRDEVLRWARSRPAAALVIPTEQEPYWVPAPDNDDEINF
ncbi:MULTISPECIES: hypothetical protein [Micromonospora]|uniref:Uncharacterized protein n=2 Tax=Micromonospora TaxID=1873 RepID=A0ABS1UGX4_9ACTN|nr:MULTISPECIES: hypothetical protein [Micromonospora]MBL6275580.1 hypothetical protein [Micromonospora fiedleri]WSK41707.1 hypothetical protein OG712_24890 [Micromonospora maris]GIJ19276.1 hypothetical protein Vgi01_59600 [Micromonospora gifhornensis]